MFKIYSCIVYTCTSVFIVCTNQCVSEIPRVLSKEVVVHFEAYGTEAQYGKNSVVRVLPSPKGCICHSPETKRVIWRTISSDVMPL